MATLDQRKRTFGTTGNLRRRLGFSRGRGSSQFSTTTTGLRSGAELQTKRGQVTDARMMIVLKQRAKITDARDRLNVIAKQTDARQRLLKLKAARKQTSPQRPMAVALTRTVNNNNRQQRSRAQNMFNTIQKQLSTRAPVAILNQRTRVQQNSGLMTRTIPGSRLSGRLGVVRTSGASVLGNVGLPTANSKRVVVGSGGIRITTANEDALERRFHDDDENMDDLEHVTMEEMPDLKKLKSVSTTSGPVTSRLSARLQSRLNPVEEVMSPLQGFKVTVSNLQPTVTQDDILELFSEIGPLRKAVLVNRGLAEVVFFKAADAEKACETYHNRQLDGKPMCVKVVRSASISTSTLQAQSSSSWGNVAGLHSDRIGSSSQFPRNRISPDIDVIRKALFHKTVPAVSSQPLFTITMAKN